MSQLFASCDQIIGISASASVLLINIHGWFPLGWTALISFLSKGLSRVFSSNTKKIKNKEMFIFEIKKKNDVVLFGVFISILHITVT